MNVAEYQSEFELSQDTPYPAFIGALWSIHCKDLKKNDHVTMAAQCISYFYV